MGSLSWWIKNIVIAILAVFFLSLSIVNLISAYELKNPAEFVMVFFGQSLLLMVSVVGILYAILQVYYYVKKDKSDSYD